MHLQIDQISVLKKNLTTVKKPADFCNKIDQFVKNSWKTQVEKPTNS